MGNKVSEHATTPQGVTLSMLQKVLRVRNRQYTLYQQPKEPTRLWTERDWVRYIDQNGHWL